MRTIGRMAQRGVPSRAVVGTQVLLFLGLLVIGTTAPTWADPGQRVLMDPPPEPSGGSGVEGPPVGEPRWVELPDLVPGMVPALHRSDPVVPEEAAPEERTPNPRISWNGITDTPGNSIIPPDTNIAVGPNAGAAGRLVMVTNGGVQIWDKNGVSIAGPTSLSVMFTSVSGGIVFDPKVLYDQHSTRFFIVALDGTTPNSNTIHIAVSTNSTPGNLTNNWTFTRGSGVKNIGAAPGTNTWADYPGIGADASALFVTTNQFSAAGNFIGSNIRVFNKAQLMLGVYTFVDITYDNAVTQGVFTIQPAHVYGATDNGGFYLINRIGAGTYRLFNVTGHPGAPVATTNTFVWAAGNFPADTTADQCIVTTPDLDTLSSRVQNAVYRSGHLWCCLTSDPDNDGQTEVVWQDIVTNSFPTNNPAVFQSGFINGSAGTDIWTYMPSINVSAAGDAAICYTESSPNICPRVSYVTRNAADALNTFQAPVNALTSAGFYDSWWTAPPPQDRDRWGDYSGCVVDPTDDCFWVANEFASTSVVNNSMWGTFIAGFCMPRACCFSKTVCADLDPATCIANGGTPRGPGSKCPTQGVMTAQHGSITVTHWTNPAIDCYKLKKSRGPSPVSTAQWTEDFDLYTAGSMLAGQGEWETWGGDPGADSVVTSAQSRSYPLSVDIVGASDSVHPYNEATSGLWTTTAWAYVPVGFQSGGTVPYRGSYLILLSKYAGAESQWAVQLHFDSDTASIKRDGVTPTYLPLITGRWVEVKVVIDLDNDLYRVFYDGAELGAAESWTAGVYNQGGGVLDIAAVDLYANNSTSVYWDDMSLLPAGDCTPGPLIDAWMTSPEETGQSMCHLFGSGDPCSPPVPAGFFGPGSDPFEGDVCLRGSPLHTTPYGSYDNADTLILRPQDPIDRCDLSPNPQTVPTEIVGLNLVSVAPIYVTYYGGGYPELWDVTVDLSPMAPTEGYVTVSRTHCNGGYYSSMFQVWPRFTFVRVNPPNWIRVLDTGDPGWELCPITLHQDQDSWVISVDPNLALDSAWCTDFHPAIEDAEPLLFSSCDCNWNGRRDDCDILGNFSQDCEPNGIPDECEPDGDVDTIPDGCDNCPTVPNPDQTDTDGDKIGDVCDLCPAVPWVIEGDHDGDRVLDQLDNCPCVPNRCQKDYDGDGLGDECDFEGDYDHDGDFDLADFAYWPGCMTGPGGGPYPPNCAPFDFDYDGDVDLKDFRGFQVVYAPCEGGAGHKPQ